MSAACIASSKGRKTSVSRDMVDRGEKRLNSEVPHVISLCFIYSRASTADPEPKGLMISLNRFFCTTCLPFCGPSSHPIVQTPWQTRSFGRILLIQVSEPKLHGENETQKSQRKTRQNRGTSRASKRSSGLHGQFSGREKGKIWWILFVQRLGKWRCSIKLGRGRREVSRNHGDGAAQMGDGAVPGTTMRAGFIRVEP